MQDSCKLLLRLFAVSIITSNVTAQVNDSIGIPASNKAENIFSVGTGVQHGFIFAHSGAVQIQKALIPQGWSSVLAGKEMIPEPGTFVTVFLKKDCFLFIMIMM